ncbi:MAG: tRNA dihydrouridine(20/20a) synthase DusA [Gammaproteobacteria bacterium]|nr:tRNA dihydrouridine(20/20a) synthase DusA [Gammaproteobacteria bacterium]
MMQYTDRHFRFLARCMSTHARLYTEMVVASAVLRGDRNRFLAHDPAETPVALQLGGSVPNELAAAAKLGVEAGYCEINLNVGCPSDRVQSGRFGACLIAEPALVAECVAAMREAVPVPVPVTVKTRLGVDNLDSYEHLCSLVSAVADAGCETLILHARKALLNFSPRANREIPPLDYPRVYAIKRAFPQLSVVINGGISSLAESVQHLEHVDGVMLGRVSYAQLDMLAEVDAVLFDSSAPVTNALAVLARLKPYVEREVASGTDLRHLSKHWLGLWQGRPGAREWRRLIGSHSARPNLRVAEAFAEAEHFMTRIPQSCAA